MRVPQRPLALVGATVLPMAGADALPQATVVVDDGRITAVRPAGDVPDGVEVLDCAGSFVMPGLADLHGHLSSRRQWPLWLAHGITTVRDMWGAPMQLAWRDEVAAGVAVGPRIVCASPYLDGPLPSGGARYPGVEPVGDPDAAAALARRHAAAGYDAFKVYSGLTPATLAAVGGVGRELGIPVIGHCPQGMTIEEALAAGLRGVEHLVEWQTGHLHERRQPPPDLIERVRAVDEALNRDGLARLADALCDAGATVTPTLGVWGRFADDDTDHVDDPALAHVPTVARQRWARAGVRAPAGHTRDELRAAVRRQQEQVGEVVGVLHRQGVRICAGTDAGSIWTVPGWSMAEELRLLQWAGLDAHAVLRAATVEAAAAVGQYDEWGRVAVGLAADLLVLDTDPRIDVAAPTRPAHVLTGGRVFDLAALDHALAAHAEWIDDEPRLAREELGPMARPEWWSR